MERNNSEFECGVYCSFRMNVREMHTNAKERQITEAIRVETLPKPLMK